MTIDPFESLRRLIQYNKGLTENPLLPQAQVPPEVEEYKKYLEQYPKISEFRPSRARKILGALAAGQTGFATMGNIPAAERTYRETLRGPYYEKLRQFELGGAPIRARAEQSIEQAKLSNEARKALSEQFERMSRGTAEIERGGYYKTVTSPDYLQKRYGYQPQTLGEREELTRLAHPKTDTPKDKMERLQKALRSHEKIAEMRANQKKGKTPTLRDRKLAEGLTDEQIYNEFPDFRKYYYHDETRGTHFIKAPAETNPEYLYFLAVRKELIDSLLVPGDENSDWELMEPEEFSEE